GLVHLLHRLPVATVDAVLDPGTGVAHVDVGVHAPCRVGALAQHARRMQGDLLVLRGTGGSVLDAVAAVGGHVEQAVAVGRAVAHGGIGDALFVLHPGPERTAGRADVVLVQAA